MQEELSPGNQTARGSYIAQVDRGGTASITVIHQANSPLSPHERRNRNQMLDRVYNFWIKDVLEKSLHNAALLELSLEYKPDAVTYPWDIVLQKPDFSERELKAGTKVSDIFDEQSGELLILGIPGSGKTTLLLELARTLILRAKQEDILPIPVIFNLSSWANKQLPIAEWLVDELNIRYDAPRKIGKHWIDDGQLLPLLDGLDEVPQSRRIACIEAINDFRGKYGLMGLVVCSRLGDYEAVQMKLKLNGAILIQPLTPDQIDSYLASLGDQLAALRNVLATDRELRDLAQTPLLLSILVMTYRKTPAGISSSATVHKERLNNLFAAYADRMFSRRGTETRYTQHQTVLWLAWLAQQMCKHNQTVFYLEQIQPDWLDTREEQRRYEIIFSVVIGLLTASLIGLSMGLALGLFWGISFGASYAISAQAALIGGPIRFIETISWSWSAVRNNIRSKISRGYKSAASFTIVIGVLSGIPIGTMLIIGAILGIVDGLANALLSGLVGNELETKVRPGQGILRSARSSVIGSITRGTVFGLTAALSIRIVEAISNISIGNSISIQLSIISGALWGWMTYGGLACLQHLTLRFILWRKNASPWDYIGFLNYAAERILLRRVGGGYIFIHRLPMEYFASLRSEQGLHSEKESINIYVYVYWAAVILLTVLLIISLLATK